MPITHPSASEIAAVYPPGAAPVGVEFVPIQGPTGPAGPAGPAGPPSVIVQQTQPTGVPVNTLWIETDGASPPNIVAVHVAVA